MQILKGKKEKQPEFNKYADYGKPQVEVSIDRKANDSQAYINAAKSHTFDSWKDADGSVFKSYPQLLDYQVEKFIKRYPAVFGRDIRPELVIIQDNQISWNKEGIRILMTDNNSWYYFLRNLDIAILDWGGFTGIITDDGAEGEKNRILDKFAIELNKLVEENNSSD